MILDTVESHWSRVTGHSVDIVAKGWVHRPESYEVYLSGTRVITLPTLEEVDEWFDLNYGTEGRS